MHHELTSIRFFPILQSILFHSAALHKMISYKTCINVQSLVIRGTLDENHSAEVPDVEAQLLAEVTAWMLKQYLSVEKYLSCSEVKFTLENFQDPDCLLAGRPLTQFDLYVSTLVPLRCGCY